MQGIKPTARLVEPFSNKVGRETILKRFFILKRVVPLGILHRPRFKPAVKHIFHSLIRSPTRMGKSNFVNKWAMGVSRDFPRSFAQFVHRANADYISAFLTTPQGDWCSPKTAAGNCPISCLFKPLTKTPTTQMLGHPMDGFI